MNKEELLKKIEEIDSLFEKLQQDTGILPIPDGIVDLESYIQSDLKIMWILKETNSIDHSNEDEWDYLNTIKDFYEKEYDKKWNKTFNSIICTSYGILNNKDWKYANENFNNEIISAIRNIAFVNIKKIRGGSKSKDATLKEFHKKYGYILEKQLEYYQPNVIICGGTWDIIDDLLEEKFGSNWERKDVHDYKTTFYQNEKQILVYTYHPQNTTISWEKYCDTIIQQVLDWKKKYRK